MKQKKKKHIFISIMGTLGCGKTTAATLLATSLRFKLLTEQYEANPFLPKFYNDMKRWAFHSQTFFLLEKARQYQAIQKLLTKRSIIQDTPIYQDVYSYARAQHALSNMTTEEWSLYQKLFTTLLPSLPKPDLIVYLDAEVPTICDRIESRGRTFENDIPITYISLLHRLNEEWIKTNKEIPVLTINTEKRNVVKSAKARKEIVELVKNSIQKINGQRVTGGEGLPLNARSPLLSLDTRKKRARTSNGRGARQDPPWLRRGKQRGTKS
jgi:deoxyadenosine/deoxycytidine kinase